MLVILPKSRICQPHILLKTLDSSAQSRAEAQPSSVDNSVKNCNCRFRTEMATKKKH